MTIATPLCHFVTSPPQGGRSGTRGDRLAKQFSSRLMAANWIDLPDPDAQNVGISGGQGARRIQAPPLWGRCHEVAECDDVLKDIDKCLSVHPSGYPGWADCGEGTMGATYRVTLQRDAEGQFIEIPKELAPLTPPIEGESAGSRPPRKDHHD